MFMQFWQQFLSNNRLVPPPLGVGAPHPPSSGKFWIRHWHEMEIVTLTRANSFSWCSWLVGDSCLLRNRVHNAFEGFPQTIPPSVKSLKSSKSFSSSTKVERYTIEPRLMYFEITIKNCEQNSIWKYKYSVLGPVYTLNTIETFPWSLPLSDVNSKLNFVRFRSV